MAQFLDFFSSISLPKNIAGDMSLLLIFLGMSLVFGFVFGRWKLVNILINVYIAVALVGVLPGGWFDFSLYARAGIFLGLLILFTAIDDRLFDVHISSAGTDFFWRLIVMSLMVTGMVVSVTLSFLPKTAALDFISVTAYGYFASPLALIFWLLMPLVSLFFINNRLK